MFARVAMFVSSYIPLYVLLVVKYAADAIWGGSEWSVFGNVAAMALIAVSAASGVLLWMISSRTYAAAIEEKGTGYSHSQFHIVSVAGNTTPDLLNYFALYFMPCLNMSIARVSDAVVMLVVMVVVGFVYLKERVTHLNPMLLLYGYRSYGCVASEVRIDGKGDEIALGDAHSEMFMRKGADPLIAGQTYDGKRHHDFIMVV